MQPTARPARSASLPLSPPRDFLAEVRTGGQRLPNRYILHGVEGIGKTTFGAHAPRPVFLMARGETGLETLIDSGRVTETSHLPEMHSWTDLLGAIQALTTQPHEFRTLVLDTLNGFERLCHQYVCDTEFNGDWSEKGFAGYMRGYEVSLPEWQRFLAALDELRAKRRMAILCLAHTKVSTFKNPEGPDFDRYTVDMHQKTWSLTHKWADMVLFANFYVTTKEERGSRPKGVGGQQRVLYTERHASYDAKNRHGLPPEIDLGDTPSAGWNNFAAALKAAAAANAKPTTETNGTEKTEETAQ